MFPLSFSRSIVAGDLDQRVAIQEPAVSRSDSGARIEDWANPQEICQRWALMRPRGSREVYRARQFAPETELVLIIEGFAAISEKMRVQHEDGRIFDILGVQSEDGRAPINAPWLQLMCREGTSKGA